MKTMVIAGGTGFLGKSLSTYFVEQGYKIIILSRTHHLDTANIQYVKWDAENLGSWTTALEKASVLINLNGKSVDCRYTPENKQKIYDTRINATHILQKACKQLKHPPALWINAASATIYRHATDRAMDEQTGELGTGFSVDVCKKWEQSFFQEQHPKIRKVALRIAIVFGKKGGALAPLKQLVKKGLGGKQGSGMQYVSWLHEKDLARIIDFVIQHKDTAGVYNAAAPTPVQNISFMKKLRKLYRIPFGLALPTFALKIGAWLIQTETELILKSRRVVPTRLLKEGFRFEYPTIEETLYSLK